MEDPKKNPGDIKSLQDIPFDELENLFESTFQEIGPKNPKKEPPIPPLFDANSDLKNKHFREKDLSDKKMKAAPREKSGLRLKYEKEVQKIQKKYGSLEDIRNELGLSQRRMALLLMVDPSAWTRWTKGRSTVPPHIWRALQWYMILQEKHPELQSHVWLNSVVQPKVSPQDVLRIQEKVVQSSREELTQKAIHYVAEEDIKRNRLLKKMEAREISIKSLQKRLFGLFCLQVITGVLLLLMLFN